jgi:glutamyl-tRNA synthetase
MIVNDLLVTRIGISPINTDFRLGGLRTYLFAWVMAERNRQLGGESCLIVKTDDTDRKKSVPEYFASLQDILTRGMGVVADVTPDDSQEIIGTSLRQSERNYIYTEVLQELVDSGFAYKPNSDSPTYFDTARYIEKFGGDVTIEDVSRGVMVTDLNTLRPETQKKGDNFGKNPLDFVLCRSDNSFVFDLATTADDISLGVNMIVRGLDRIPCSFRQQMVINSMGRKSPKYLHTPPLVGSDGQMLKKIDSNTESFIGDIAHSGGTLPLSIAEYLISSCGSNPENVASSWPEIIAKFDPLRLSRTPTRFDLNKLNSTNRMIFHSLHDDELEEQLTRFSIITRKQQSQLPLNKDVKVLISNNRSRARVIPWSISCHKEIVSDPETYLVEVLPADKEAINEVVVGIKSLFRKEGLESSLFKEIAIKCLSKDGKIQMSNIIKWVFLGKVESILHADDILRFMYNNQSVAKDRLQMALEALNIL